MYIVYIQSLLIEFVKTINTFLHQAMKYNILKYNTNILLHFSDDVRNFSRVLNNTNLFEFK